MKSCRIAVAIPCHNEEAAIAGVVAAFRSRIPAATIYVMDNASTDQTVEVARRAGAQVEFVPKKGKGSVVREIFRRIEADVYLMVDGDGTYPSEAAEDLLAPVLNGEAEMVIGSRMENYRDGDSRPFHWFGNRVIRALVRLLFKGKVDDVLSGYRVLSRHFAKTTPILSDGFEVETEMTLQALDRGIAITEIPVSYAPRPAGSQSKLNTVRDGYLILRMIVTIFKDYKPLAFFGLSGLVAAFSGVMFGMFVINEYLTTGAVTHPSTAMLAAALCLAGGVSVTTGLVLDTINRRAREQQILLGNQLSVAPIPDRQA